MLSVHALTRRIDMQLVARSARAAWPGIAFGLRLWASVCFALYIAYWLELENSYWAGTSAAIVCQPHLGASLRKGWFRMLGTIVGALVIVSLTALFPQERGPFLLALALWGGVCALFATILRNFAAYSAALAGFTASIIASDQLGSVGGLNGEAFTLAISRTSEIIIGIVCAGVVLAATDFGRTRRQLADLLAGLVIDIGSGFSSTLEAGHAAMPSQPVRRDLTRRVIALDPVIDIAIGESSGLRYHSSILKETVNGLFSALAGWRGVAAHLARMQANEARSEADAIIAYLPPEMKEAPLLARSAFPMRNPAALRRRYEAAASKFLALPVDTPSLRLLADEAAKVLFGIAEALGGLALLVADPERAGARRYSPALFVPDWLPGLVNATRAVIAIAAAEVFWIATAWPSGAQVITWVAISVILFAPRADDAYSFALSFMIGAAIAAVFAAIIAFAVLPKIDTFAGFSAILGLYLIPVGALMVQPWQSAIFVTMIANFIPLLGPTNEMTYDTVQFYNNALAIIAGTGAAAFSFRILPPLSPSVRARRLLALTLRDVRRLALGATSATTDVWQARIYGRLLALPTTATPLQRAQLLAALSVGEGTIKLRGIADRLGEYDDLAPAFRSLAEGEIEVAIEQLSRLDLRFASLQGGERDPDLLRARSTILGISEAVHHHAAYFGAGP